MEDIEIDGMYGFKEKHLYTETQSITKKELRPFVEDYITFHKYFKITDLSYEYIFKELNYTPTHTNYVMLKHKFNHKFARVIRDLVVEGKIRLFNTKTYTKIIPPNNASKLVFIDGKFRNPNLI